MDKVKTAEETLSKITGEEGLYITHGMVRGSEALEAMETYATQQSRIDAINFAEWCVSNPNVYFNYGKHNKERFTWNEKTISPEKLYELYLLSINKK